MKERCECHDCTQLRAHPMIFFDPAKGSISPENDADISTWSAAKKATVDAYVKSVVKAAVNRASEVVSDGITRGQFAWVSDTVRSNERERCLSIARRTCVSSLAIESGQYSIASFNAASFNAGAEAAKRLIIECIAEGK